MELFDGVSRMEEVLVAKADALNLPIGGTMELLPLCNMDCKMCYVRQTKAQMDRQGRMLTCDEWLKIAAEAKAAGVLFLLLTGGEPLMYPEFERLYTTLMQMGFVITLNTNATLLDEKWAALCGNSPCRRISITLNGKDDEPYGALCGNPRGFTQVTHAAELLTAHHVPFRFTCSVTPYNKDQLPALHRVAQHFGVPLEPCHYMFPPHRRDDNDERFLRLSPDEAADSVIAAHALRNPHIPLQAAAVNSLAQLCRRTDFSKVQGFVCRAAHSGFWMNWKGELLPCGMFTEPKMSLLDHSFPECWAHICAEVRKLRRCADCDTCAKRPLCKTCAASCLTETGSVSGKPEYLCRMTDHLIDRCRALADGSEL